MLERIVEYLRTNRVAFRLGSSPSSERLPSVAHHLPPGGRLVETAVVLIAGRPAIACVAAGSGINERSLSAELGTAVIEGSTAALPEPWRHLAGPVPPLGGLLGVPILLDHNLAAAGTLTFQAFSANDYFELSVDDFTRLECPRMCAIAIGGELPEATHHAP